jgi:hypothetical protein
MKYPGSTVTASEMHKEQIPTLSNRVNEDRNDHNSIFFE